VAAGGLAVEIGHGAGEGRGIGGAGGEAHQAQHRHVVGVVAQKSHLVGCQPGTGQDVVQTSHFILNAQVQFFDAELGGAGAHRGRGLARDDARGDAQFAQAHHAHAVADVKTLHFLASFGVVHAAIGEHAVAVGEDEANAAGAGSEVG